MTIREVLVLVDKIKPGNPYDIATKVQWLNELESDLQVRRMKKDPSEITLYTEADLDVTLILPPPFDKAYWMWVSAMIDFVNGEFEKYQNTLQLVNDTYDNYAKWYHRTFHRNACYQKE